MLKIIFAIGVALAILATGLGAGTLYLSSNDDEAPFAATGCAFGWGHWSQQAAWPADPVRVAGEAYGAQQLRGLVMQSADTDASVALLAQLAALKLNIADGRIDAAQAAAAPSLVVAEALLGQAGRAPLAVDPFSHGGFSLTSAADDVAGFIEEAARVCLGEPTPQPAAAVPLAADEVTDPADPAIVPGAPAPAVHPSGGAHVPVQNQEDQNESEDDQNESQDDQNQSEDQQQQQQDDENDPDFGNQDVPGCEQECNHDVSLEKISQVNDQQQEGNDRVDYQFRVRSIGQNTVTNVTLTDELFDFGGTWVIGGADGDDCELTDNRHLVCEFGDMPPGSVRTVVASSALCEIGCGEDVVNTAVVTADEDDHPENNEDSAVVEREPCPEEGADVTVDKEAETTLNTGPNNNLDRVEFFLTVESIGSETAKNVTLEDELPDFDTSWNLSGPDADDCEIQQGAPNDTLVCDFGDLEPGEIREVTVTSSLCDLGCGDDIPNTATVSADNDANETNNEDTAFVDRPPCGGGDADVEKTANFTDSETTGNDTVEYTIGVTSDGEETVEDVVLTDELPDTGANWTLGGPDADECTIDENDVVTCDFGDLEPGDSREITLTSGPFELGCGDEDLENTATVSSSNDVDPSNDNDTATVDRPPCEAEDGADARVVKQSNVTADEETGGDVVLFTITVESIGISTVQNVTLFDSLPNFDTNWTVFGPDAGDCLLTDNADTNDTVECVYGDLDPGETRTIFVESDPFPGACDEFVLNTASISADNDEVPENDNSTVPVCDDDPGEPPGPGPDVAASKEQNLTTNTTSNLTVINYTITVESVGAEDAFNVTLNDTLPTINATWEIGGPDVGACTLDENNNISCDFGRLNVTEFREIFARSTPVPIGCGGDVVNTARANAANDTDPTNNNATVNLTRPVCPPLFLLGQAFGLEMNQPLSLGQSDTGLQNSTTDFFVQEQFFNETFGTLTAVIEQGTTHGNITNFAVHSEGELVDVLDSVLGLRAEAIVADVVVTCDGFEATGALVRASIGATELPVEPAPNTQVPLGPLGTLTLNRQVVIENTTTFGNLTVTNRYVEVTAFHLELTNGTILDIGFAFAGIEGCVASA